MEDINTTIQLNDLISGPLLHISSAMNMCVREFVQMQAVAGQSFSNTNFSNVRVELGSTNVELDEMIVNIRENTSAQNDFKSSINSSSGIFDNLSSKIIGVVDDFATLQNIGKVIGISDEVAQTTARLNLLTGSLVETQELQDKIYLSVERSRTSYLDTADAVSKMGLNAGNAFSSNDEIIAFIEQVNKQLAIGGASSVEMSNAMVQLTQSMANGALRGEELNTILDTAPGIARAIEANMGWAEGSIKSYAEEGLITADVVKNSMINMSKQTNTQFESMPMTWSQVMTSMQNVALRVFDPVLDKINELTHNTEVQNMATGIVNIMAFAASAVMEIFNLAAQMYSVLASVGSFISDNWSILAPLIYGAAIAIAMYIGFLTVFNTVQAISNGIKAIAALRATVLATSQAYAAGATFTEMVAVQGLNAALLACPLTWIIITIIAIIAIIYAVVAAINHFAGTSISATGVAMGVFATLGAFIGNLFFAVFDLILGVINALVNPFINIANFIGNIFTNPISSVIYGFQDMADGILGIIEKIASAMDFVFGSHMADTVGEWRSGLKDMADAAVTEYAPNENYQSIMDNLNLRAEDLGIKRFEYGDAYRAGNDVGEGLDKKIANFNPASLFDNTSNIPSQDDYDTSQIPTNIQNTADNTQSIKDSVELTGEDLKYLRDAAETEIINRFTTAEIKVEMGGITNNVSSREDLDGIGEYLKNKIEEEMQSAAEGVH